MTEPFLGEVQLFGFNFAPYQWAMCNGAVMGVTQNTALFSLLGVTYGGNGQTPFALPNLISRAPCNQGQGPALSNRVIGETFGDQSVVLTTGEIPAHSHSLTAYAGANNRAAGPSPGAAISPPGLTKAFLPNGVPDTTLWAGAVSPAGSGLPHENQQPLAALTWAIALSGVFPSFG